MRKTAAENITDLLDKALQSQAEVLRKSWDTGDLETCKTTLREIRRVLDATEDEIKSQLYFNLGRNR